MILRNNGLKRHMMMMHRIAQDSELVAALQERDEEDEEEADESVERVPIILAEARKAREALRIFLQENQTARFYGWYGFPEPGHREDELLCPIEADQRDRLLFS